MIFCANWFDREQTSALNLVQNYSSLLFLGRKRVAKQCFTSCVFLIQKQFVVCFNYTAYKNQFFMLDFTETIRLLALNFDALIVDSG